ncbi:hypothetical protein CFC21_004126 [Triticum aestivum]|uniref:F-box domain-containing protein n=1 Tax=Triticum aestivum TaxID=4565 RepID=A0A3B5Y6Q7_WHEAT|nr:uncharacterized protein LOC123181562 [Triticum aestivum]KAF6986357.1 hypothetical protein CFC21_004126 [Triticum aestivum]
MDSKKVITAANHLTNDLVVEILSRVLFKTFCRIKCVCKAWLAFPFDPHYNRKLPKIPTGVLCKGHNGSSIQVVNMSPDDKKIDGTLRFIPHHEQLQVVDCSNGLVLCRYKSFYTFGNTCRFIVCNPATQEWRALPVSNTNNHPYVSNYSRCTTFLTFDPSWSPQFYVFNFLQNAKGRPMGIRKLEVFSSELFTWLVDDAWSSDHRLRFKNPHSFVGGVLHVQTNKTNEILVVQGLEAMSSAVVPCHYIIRPPENCLGGCFGQSLGVLQWACPEESGHVIKIFHLDAYRPCKWSLKHRLRIRDAFERDDFVPIEEYLQWLCDFEIVALDFERGVIFLFEKYEKKLLWYNINTGKLNEIKDDRFTHGCEYYSYVACYSKLPA